MQDFFARQAEAHRHTRLLLALFITASILIILTVYLAITLGLYIAQSFNHNPTTLFVEHAWDMQRFLWVTGCTCILIACGSLYRTRQLRHGGGAAVASMLGGQPVPPASAQLQLIQLRNVVEEMAIASGLPVPPVYLLPEPAINAFAAGFDSRDAVIAVTQGTVDLLNRDELQGVIAHEFSHILNGDTGLKMRLMGMLYGITLISDIGIVLITARGNHYNHRERSSHPAVMVIGFLLFMVGTIGAVCADLIKRAVSRQREFLADAAAVQFTRNPAGLASALKRIGGYKAGSRIHHSHAGQVSHFFFSAASSSWGYSRWWASHPPLNERIRRLDPGFDGHYPSVNATGFHPRHDPSDDMAASPLLPQQPSPPVSTPAANIRSDALEHARGLLDSIPPRIMHFIHDPFTARAVIYAMLLDRRNSKLRTCQLERLQQQADAAVFGEVLAIQSSVARLQRSLYLPLLEMAVPALKSMSKLQFNTFRQAIRTLMQADASIDLFEYMLQRMLLRHLYPAFLQATPLSVRWTRAEQIQQEAATIICLLIQRGSHSHAQAVYRQSMQHLKLQSIAAMPACSGDAVAMLDSALKKVERAARPVKQALLAACRTAVLADGHTATDEIELLRTIADALDAPMPALDKQTGS